MDLPLCPQLRYVAQLRRPVARRSARKTASPSEDWKREMTEQRIWKRIEG